MDYNIERRFAQTFIRKEKRDRLLYELTTPKKRYAGLDRFCHQAEDLLDPAKITMSGEDLDRAPAFEEFVRSHDDICYVLSPELGADGLLLPFKDALQQAVMCFDAVLIIGSTFAVVFGEVMKGGRGKYLLSEERISRR